MVGPRRLPWLGGLLWATSIFVTSSGVVTTDQLAHTVSTVAGGRVSETGFEAFWGIAWWLFVKGWHATEFGILFALLRRAFGSVSRWPAILAVSYAFFDEAHQLFVPGRGSRLSDVCIDCLGILAAWLILERHRFPSRWLLATYFLAIAGAIFLLSIIPFGLMTLPGANTVFRGAP